MGPGLPVRHFLLNDRVLGVVEDAFGYLTKRPLIMGEVRLQPLIDKHDRLDLRRCGQRAAQ